MLRVMNSHRDDPDAPLMKPARWVSPWSFDDEWEIAHLKRDAAAAADSRTLPKARPRIPTPSNVAARAVGEPKVRTVVHEQPVPPAPASRVKSFESFGDMTEIQEAPPVFHETSRPKAEAMMDAELFQPPPRTPEKEEAKMIPPAAPPVVDAPSARPVPPPAPTAAPEPVIQPRRPAAVPTSLGRGRTARFSWTTPIVLCLGLAGCALLAWIYLTDTEPGPDDDLRIQVPVDQTVKVAAPERLKVFLNAVHLIENMEVALKPAWSWDTPALASYVSSNGVAFDNLRDLLEDFDWHPHHAAWHAEDLGEHAAWPHVRILLQAQAAYLVRLGNEEAALTAAIDIAEMSRRMQELWAWPSFMQRAQEMHMASVQTTAEILKQTRLSSQGLKPFQDDFIRCEPSDMLLQGGLNAFYIHEKKLLFGEKSGEPLDTMPGGVTQERAARLFFKKHETLGLFADAFRLLRDEAVVAPFAALGQSSQSVRHVRRPRTPFFQPNGAGEAYFSDRIDPYLIMPERLSLAKARHSLVLSLFAIRRYVADHQKLPASLVDLSPKYLMDVPMDPFSGEPLQYDPLKGLLFSVGVNFLKEGGKITQPPLLDPDEPTVDLGIAVAVPVKAAQ